MGEKKRREVEVGLLLVESVKSNAHYSVCFVLLSVFQSLLIIKKKKKTVFQSLFCASERQKTGQLEGNIVMTTIFPTLATSHRVTNWEP